MIKKTKKKKIKYDKDNQKEKKNMSDKENNVLFYK